MIDFNPGKKSLPDEWGSDAVSERLKNLLRIIALKFSGIIITCLVRSEEQNRLVGGVKNSLHVPQNAPSGKCEACDFILRDPNAKPQEVSNYMKKWFLGVDIIYYPASNHFHIEADTPEGVHVEMM